MDKAKLAARSRLLLDAQLAALPPPAGLAPPIRGWIKAIREALGMTSAQFAARLGVKQPSVVAIEQSEARGTIQLDTLRRAAAALDCTLVYALVPRESLEEIVRGRARELARKQLAEGKGGTEPAAGGSAGPEGAVDDADEARLDDLAAAIKPRRLWDEG
jgi:predicted DNA-binding mobile mystery protein A